MALQPTVILNVRIPLDLATKLEALVKEGEHQWPRLSKQGLVITLLNLGVGALAQKVIDSATPRPKRKQVRK